VGHTVSCHGIPNLYVCLPVWLGWDCGLIEWCEVVRLRGRSSDPWALGLTDLGESVARAKRSA